MSTPAAPRNQYGRAITSAAASWRLARRYARTNAEDAGDCQEDLDRNDLGSRRAAQAIRIENYRSGAAK